MEIVRRLSLTDDVFFIVPENKKVKIKQNKRITNKLLDGLPVTLQQSILKECKLANLSFGEILFEQGQIICDVLFPLSGFVSLVSSSSEHPPLEMGLIGNEGMLGITQILGVNSAPDRAIVQGTGTALSLSSVKFQSLLKLYPILHQRHNDYLYILLKQQSRSLACVKFHHIEQRLARWLLMTHDRAHSNHFYLTHSFLADMLGVRRSGITVAAGELQDKKLIAYTRGDISILDRKGLELMACECYQLSKTDYLEMMN
jgi:CRP-like cAMP-binding protein